MRGDSAYTLDTPLEFYLNYELKGLTTYPKQKKKISHFVSFEFPEKLVS